MRKNMIMLPICLLFIFALLAGTAYSKSGKAWPTPKNIHPHITNIHPQFMISPSMAYDWHLIKDEGGPTYAGSPSWQSHLEFVESKLVDYGVVDIVRNSWKYDRWYTSEFPEDHNWTLVSNGEDIQVASYGAYSGSTTEDGITAELIYYDPQNPPASIAGKIVVFDTAPHPTPPYPLDYILFFTMNDYEYLTDFDSWPELFTRPPVSESITYDVWYQLRQTTLFNNIMKTGEAAGGVIIFDASYDRLSGLYTFGVPTLYNVPNLYLDRKAGEKVREDAIAGKTATLRLIAEIEEAEAYQLIGFLPGRNYGTPDDEQIILATHTDGPAISQDNGALGILGILHYFSHIAQVQRPKTLMVFLDCRHYMPGMEAAFAEQDWFSRNPNARIPIVSGIAMEHLGQIEYREVGDIFEPTGQVEGSFLWARPDQKLIDKAIKAVQDHQWPRCIVQAPERLGINGGPQGVWYGMGRYQIVNPDIPGFATMGTQGSYWATTARINKFDPYLFYTQVAAMSQLTGELMVLDLPQFPPKPNAQKSQGQN